MRKPLFIVRAILLGLFTASLTATIFQFTGSNNLLAKFNYKKPVYNNKEEFDPLLSRLNSVETLAAYCDSLYLIRTAFTPKDSFAHIYTDIVSGVIIKRFYHGYSYYGFDDNYVAILAAKATTEGYSAIVIPDDILKHPYAACSQQTIVMMEVLKIKNFETRKISFQGKTSGHFSFEVYYNGSWHFYDPNLEPDVKVLNSYNRPDIAFLSAHPDILKAAYKRYPELDVVDVFSTFSYGDINEFPAPKAIIFQKISKLLSYSAWIYFLIGYLLVNRRYLMHIRNNYVRNRRIYFSPSQSTPTASYYPGITAPGS